jgi:hypothetical protein
MKKIFGTIALFALILTFNACSEDEYNSKYVNPSTVSTTSVDKLMTGTLRAGFDFVTPNYWRFFGHDNQGIGALSQNWGMPMSTSLYDGGYSPYRDDGTWSTYHKTLTQYKTLEALFATLAPGEQRGFAPYYLTAKAFVSQILLQTLDEIGGSTDGKGGVPYSEAGLLPVTGELVYPSLDPAPQLYKMILDNLAEVNSLLPDAGSVAADKDFINDGNMDKWRKYTNSIRLRAAIRLSSQGELTATAESVIKEILNDPAGHPLVTGYDDMIQVVNRGDGDFNWSRLEGIKDGYDNGNWNACRTASKPMLDLLGAGTDAPDPRLPLIYDMRKDLVKEYRGVELAPGKVEGDYNDFSGSTTPPYSWVNHTSFIENKNVAGYVVTPSEIYFYKAEAIQRGLISGDAKAEFVKGIKESVKLYALINANSTNSTDNIELSPKVDMTAWTEDAVEAYAATKWKDNTDCIYEQLWLHCGIINVVESWNTIRRTGIPKLYYPTVLTSKSKTVPQRLVIPRGELQFNKTLSSAGIDVDVSTGYLVVPFWAKKVE